MFKWALLIIFLLNSLDLALTIYGVHVLKTVKEANPLFVNLIHNHPIKACLIKISLAINVIVILALSRKHTKKFTDIATGIIITILSTACIWNLYQIWFT